MGIFIARVVVIVVLGIWFLLWWEILKTLVLEGWKRKKALRAMEEDPVGVGKEE